MKNKLFKTASISCVLAVLALFLAQSGPSQAAPPAETCGSIPNKWGGLGSAPFEINRNSTTIPSSGNIYWGYRYGVDAWNDISATQATLGVETDSSISFSDDVNEVALVNPVYLPTGVDGLTSIVDSGCTYFPSEGGIWEADIIVSNTLSFSDPSAMGVGGAGRVAMIHEMGHLFNFDHVGLVQATMMPVSPGPMVAGTPSAVLWPDDVKGVRDLYGLSSSLPNLVVSGMRPVNTANGPKAEPIEDDSDDVCRGETNGGYVRMYVGNAGNSSTGTFNLRFYLGVVASSGGTDVATYYGNFAAFHEVEQNFYFTVPGSVATGDYTINVYADSTGSVAEVSNQDNWTISNKTIKVKVCP